MKWIAAMLCALMFAAPCLAEDFEERGCRKVMEARPGEQLGISMRGGMQRPFVICEMKGEGKNTLCVAEERGGEFVLTIQNEKALLAGEEVSMILDTGEREGLFYSYVFPSGKLTVHTAQQPDGTWTNVDLLYQKNIVDGVLEEHMLSMKADGTAVYETMFFDENENWLQDYEGIQKVIKDVPSMRFEDFDLSALLPLLDDQEPVFRADLYKSLLQDGEKEIGHAAIDEACMLMEVQKPDGTRVFRLCTWTERGRTTQDSLPIPKDLHLDEMNSGKKEVCLQLWETKYIFHLLPGGRDARLGFVQGQEELELGWNYLAENRESMLSNNGVVYGTVDGITLMNSDLSALPERIEDVQADQSAYALVCNPDPKDRLNLRERPDQSSYSQGKFYNRTPVLILSDDGGDWVRVRIGCEQGLEGWMMRRFLVFDEKEKVQVNCAYEQLIAHDKAMGAPVYALPNEKTEPFAQYFGMDNEFVIGVYGEKWVIVMLDTGEVGYVLRDGIWGGYG